MKENIFYLEETLSPEAFDVCTHNKIHNLHDLIQYYLKNNSFKNFKNSDEKTSNELIALCSKHANDYSEIIITNTDKNHELVQEKNEYKITIHLDNIMSSKSVNICSDNEIYNFLDLKQYYLTNRSFKKFRNSNKVTNLELVEVCIKYIDNNESYKIKKKQEKFDTKTDSPVNNMSEQLQLPREFNDLIKDKNEQKITIHLDDLLSPKTVNICSDNEIYSFQDLKQYYITNKSFKKFRNSNKLTNFELVEVCIKYIDNNESYKIKKIQEKFETKFDSPLNMSLEHLLSPRAFNICSDNGIYSFQGLVNYYLKNNSFYKLRNCGEKTNSELIEFCIKHSFTHVFSNGMPTPLSKDFILTKIEALNDGQKQKVNKYLAESTLKLSERSKNGINRLLKNEINLDGFLPILLIEDFHFNKITNIGKKSIIELNMYLLNIKEYISQISDIKDEGVLANANSKKNIFLEKVDGLNRIQRQIINNNISYLTSMLSVRSRNAINVFLDLELNIKQFSDKIFSNEDFNLNNIKNIGASSISELKIYLNNIRQFTQEVLDIDDERELNKLKTIFFLRNKFNITSIPKDIHSLNTIFKLTDFLLNKNLLLNNVNTYIFKKTINLYNTSTYISLKQIAAVVDLNNERIRQIRSTVIDVFLSKLEFINSIDKNIILDYNIDLNSSYIVVDDEKAKHINAIDGTNFSRQFITLILSLLMKDEFVLIGSIDDSVILKESNSRLKHKWKNIYLVNNHLQKYFYFEKFIQDIGERINERIEETYKFNFKSYLSKFLVADNLDELDKIFIICEQLINEEFNLFLNIDEDIVFERNTIKTLREYALEALEKLGKPSHIDDIDRQVKILHPSFDRNITNINLKREFGFVPFGRKSVFGLKKWEKEKVNIKGGTIRCIAEEFLENYDTPMNIKNISEYVLQFRPESNEKSILYNMKMEENNRFVFFKNTYIGLKSKKYNVHEYSLLNDTEKLVARTWEENYQELLDFISRNKRYPLSSSCPVEELKLSRWLNVQSSKVNRDLLDSVKTKLILKLKSENNNQKNNRTAIHRNDGYYKLTEFIEKEHRLPSANKKDERQLYSFFYKQRKLYEEYKLTSEEEENFLNIAKLIQKY